MSLQTPLNTTSWIRRLPLQADSQGREARVAFGASVGPLTRSSSPVLQKWICASARLYSVLIHSRVLGPCARLGSAACRMAAVTGCPRPVRAAQVDTNISETSGHCHLVTLPSPAQKGRSGQ